MATARGAQNCSAYTRVLPRRNGRACTAKDMIPKTGFSFSTTFVISLMTSFSTKRSTGYGTSRTITLSTMTGTSCITTLSVGTSLISTRSTMC